MYSNLTPQYKNPLWTLVSYWIVEYRHFGTALGVLNIKRKRLRMCHVSFIAQARLIFANQILESHFLNLWCPPASSPNLASWGTSLHGIGGADGHATAHLDLSSCHIPCLQLLILLDGHSQHWIGFSMKMVHTRTTKCFLFHDRIRPYWDVSRSNEVVLPNGFYAWISQGAEAK